MASATAAGLVFELLHQDGSKTGALEFVFHHDAEFGRVGIGGFCEATDGVNFRLFNGSACVGDDESCFTFAIEVRKADDFVVSDIGRVLVKAQIGALFARVVAAGAFRRRSLQDGCCGCASDRRGL